MHNHHEVHNEDRVLSSQAYDAGTLPQLVHTSLQNRPEVSATVARIMSTLTEGQIEVVVMRAAGLTYAEIGQYLGLSVTATRSRFITATKRAKLVASDREIEGISPRSHRYRGRERVLLRDAIGHMYDAGFSVNQLMKVTGKSYALVVDLISEHHRERRNQDYGS